MGKIKVLAERVRKKAKKLRKKVKRVNRQYLNRKKYIWYRENCPIEEKAILLETLNGQSPDGNINALLKELTTGEEYTDFQIYLSCRRKDIKERRKYLEALHISGVTLLDVTTKEYFKVLATAKYLVNEHTFFIIFNKRPEQVYLNTWHGTPLKCLGNKVANDFATFGNVQKNMFDADYLLCPNEFTMQHFIDDFCLSNFGHTKLMLGGYPRNQAFFDEKRRQEIRMECGFGEKQIIVFMPTWRGVIGNVTSEMQNEILKNYFDEWDEKLKDNQVLYVKLHPLSRGAIDVTQYTHIVPFPADKYDTYEFLNAADVLVTDYSSVFFDFAASGRKIVLFTYDKEEYMQERGMYFSVDELPFPQASNIDELTEYIIAPKNYDDTEFLQKFCAYDVPGMTKAICHQFLFNETCSLLDIRMTPDNGKKNVVLYVGNLERNGITTSAVNLLSMVDKEKYNFAVLYKINAIKKRQDCIKMLPEGVSTLSYYHARSATMWETFCYMLFQEFHLLPYKPMKKLVEKVAQREYGRILGNCRIDKAIQFFGYEHELIELLEQAPCERTIFVHNDMEEEIRSKHTLIRSLLSREYRKYDNVAIVTEDLRQSTQNIAIAYQDEDTKKEANLVLVKNTINYKSILERAEQELLFDERTRMNVEEEELRAALTSDKKKFISVGRFSKEKGHARLISAFETLHKEQPNTLLFILGGYGVLYNETIRLVEKSSCPDSIFIIRYMSNPYPLMKACDYLALPSLYEGFGLVLAEADILGLPCFSTDITGPKLFMEQVGGYLVEDSREGVLEGLRACLDGRVPKKLNVDYEEYNREAIAQFESLLP